MTTPPTAPAEMTPVPNRYMHQKYHLKRQWAKLVGANFRIYDPSENLCFFVNQKGFKLKEDIRVYMDEAKSQEILSIKARQIMDFAAAYDVIDTVSGQKVGALKRKGWKSMIKDEWIIMDPYDREIGLIKEDQMLLALLRRFLTNLIPQSFDIEVQGRKVMDLRQAFNPFVYRSEIDFTPDPGHTFDRRLGIAIAVLLCAIEGRQGGGGLLGG